MRWHNQHEPYAVSVPHACESFLVVFTLFLVYASPTPQRSTLTPVVYIGPAAPCDLLREDLAYSRYPYQCHRRIVSLASPHTTYTHRRPRFVVQEPLLTDTGAQC